MELLNLVPVEAIEPQKFYDYINEWENEKLVPFALRLNGRDYNEWKQEDIDRRSKENCPPGIVPSLTLFLVELDGNILGTVNIRRYLNENLEKFGGHIGYGIRPSFRGRGYGKAQLGMTLKMCRAFGMTKVLITCDKSNIASDKIIQYNGGVLENEIEEENKIIQRYWIEI